LIAEPGDLFLIQEPFLYPTFSLHKFHARLKINADGSLQGIIGGYQPIEEIYYACANGNINADMDFCEGGPGIYYLLKKFADADPDQKTGQNSSISIAHYLEAVPAYVVPVTNTLRHSEVAAK
jgi:hypothetical protein